MATAPYKRATRFASRIRADVTELLARGRLRDERLLGLMVTHVQVSEDLRHVDLYVLVHGASELQRKSVMEGLAQSQGFLRRELALKMESKYVPQVRMHWDTQTEGASRVDAILNDLARSSDHDESNREAPGQDDGQNS